MKKQIYIEELLEKYFEGQTSLKEEKVLREYFRQDNIPEAMETYRPMFAFFSDERGEESHKVKRSPHLVWIRWTSMSVAAAVMLFLGIKFIFLDAQRTTSTQSIVYIDGEKFTDLNTIQKETLNTLDAFSSTNDDVIASQIDMLESLDDF